MRPRASAWILAAALALATGCKAGTPVVNDGGDAGRRTDQGDPDSGGVDQRQDQRDGYALLFNQDRIVEVALEIAPEDLERIYADPFSREYVPATFIYDGESLDRVGVRIKGNLQINFMLAKGEHKFSFKVDFNRFVPGQTFHGLKKTNLHNVVNDPSFLREKIAYDLFGEAAVPASRAAYVNLSVNGERHGVYNHVEQVDSVFLAHHFGNKDGNLYKPSESTLIYQGDAADAYQWELFGVKNSESDPEHVRVIELMRVLSDPDRPSFSADLEAIFSVDDFLRFLAINTFIINLDTYTPLGHNYYLYDDTSRDKLVFIPWDMSEAFGNFACLPDDAMLDLDIRAPYCGEGERDSAPLFASILAQPAYLQRYLDIMAELVAAGSGILAEDLLVERLRSTHGYVAGAVEADPLRHYSFEDFVANLDRAVPNQATDVSAAPAAFLGLTQVARQRSLSVMRQLGQR